MGFDEMSTYDRTAWDACLKAVYDIYRISNCAPVLKRKIRTVCDVNGIKTIFTL